MSSERFDKLMKKNLESVRPDYQPRAWDRFSKRLPAAGFLPWMQQYGGWAASGLMLLGWLTTLYTLRENQELMRQMNTTAKQELISAAPQNGTESTTPIPGTATQKTDTVYIVKKTIVEHRHFYQDSPDLLTRSRDTSQEDVGNDIEKTGTNSETKGKIDENNILLTQTSGSEQFQKEPESKIPAESTANSQENQHEVLAAKTDTALSNAEQDEVVAVLDSNQTVQRYSYKMLAAMVDSLSSKKAAIPVARPKRPPFRLSMLQPRLGMESLLSLHSYGIGPVVELFPTENLGLSVGIQASTLEAENHKLLRDYNSATGKFFLVQYRSYLPSKFDRIEDISIKTSLVSIPVSLKYYIPLKKNVSVFVQSGTSLDVSAYQQVDFESYLNNSKRRNSFETDAKPHFFHNFMFGAGVQYRKSRVLAQLSPYFVYDFRNIENTPSGSNLGLRASLWLNLFK